MTSSKKMYTGSKDLISSLPNPVISHILSYLPTKQAASTSVLSKRWRFLFASVTNLEFADGDDSESFMGFVDRVMAVQGNHTINRFSLECGYYPDPLHVTAWILNVLSRGVSEFELSVLELPLPSQIFVSKTLVKLKLGPGDDLIFGSDVEQIFLPKLKSLHIDSVFFKEEGDGFAKLLSGCPVLEELVLTSGWWTWNICSVSVPTLKRLTVFSEEKYNNPKSVSFDTPSLLYLEYSDTIADEYPKLNFDSLVEAHICLRLLVSQREEANMLEDMADFSVEHDSSDGDGYYQENGMVGNATEFFTAIRNVKILYLSAKSIEVLTFRCEATPVFNNLSQLTIESDPKIGWDSLPGLLENCPNLETLVFKGLLHRSNDGCGNICCCKSPKNPSYLSSSTVKVLKVIMTMPYDDKGMEIEQIKHFLENMASLEKLVVYFDETFNPSVFDLSKKLQNMPRMASPKCKIQVLSQNLNLSPIMSPSLSKKWSAPPSEDYAWFLNALA